MIFTPAVILAGLALSAAAVPLEERQTACSAYTLINTRGTGEPQGESSGFRTIDSNVRSQVSGGSVYNTIYAADYSQNSAAGTTDIANKVASLVRANPNVCVILEGYSQGAAATVNAMSRLTGTSYTTVKGVLLFGDPEHKAGLACNVDQNGGTTTLNVNGISAYGSAGIPSNWVAKTLDVCNYGDGVCDTTHGSGINQQHLAYPQSTTIQNLGTKYIVGRLRGTS
nr:hypothetical protein B0A51_14407 [Rachicladosporium sp. CCFEE 5018]